LFSATPKSLIKSIVNVIKVVKATPTIIFLMPTKNNDDDGETFDEVLHNTCIQYFLFASAASFVDWNPSC
jgi:hypothetical protein